VDGSPKHGITAAAAEHALDRAYASWTNAWCGIGTPSIQAFRLEQVTCKEAQVNRCDRNASAWIFHDEDWPYGDDDPTIALAWTHFDPETGEILDADVEVNTAQHDITIGGNGIEFIDVATHEAGHIFGLGHSLNHNATMFASYHFTGQITALHPDDVAGICTIYPPDRDVGECVPEPLNGFASECVWGTCEPEGCCATAPGHSNKRHWVALLGIGLGLALWRRRRNSRR
jgi:MYXO-CTERM domain-containing protein